MTSLVGWLSSCRHFHSNLELTALVSSFFQKLVHTQKLFSSLKCVSLSEVGSPVSLSSASSNVLIRFNSGIITIPPIQQTFIADFVELSNASVTAIECWPWSTKLVQTGQTHWPIGACSSTPVEKGYAGSAKLFFLTCLIFWGCCKYLTEHNLYSKKKVALEMELVMQRPIDTDHR
jgi:hypothetical protein